MKPQWLVVLLVCVAATPLANAVILSANAVTADPTVTVTDSNWNGDVESLFVKEAVSGKPASIVASFVTDPSVGDPRAWIRKSVENDTTFAWSSYIIDLTLPQNFTVDALQPMANWTAVALPVTPLPEGGYGTTIQFTADPGAAIPVGNWGEFDFRVVFPGTVQFSVTQTPVAPEPATLALLALGGLLIRRTRR